MTANAAAAYRSNLGRPPGKCQNGQSQSLILLAVGEKSVAFPQYTGRVQMHPLLHPTRRIVPCIIVHQISHPLWKLEIREGATLSRSPGSVLLRGWLPTMRDILLRNMGSDGAGVGRSAPLQPLGDGVREGATLSRSPGGCSGGGAGSRRGLGYFLEPTARGRRIFG